MAERTLTAVTSRSTEESERKKKPHTVVANSKFQIPRALFNLHDLIQGQLTTKFTRSGRVKLMISLSSVHCACPFLVVVPPLYGLARWHTGHASRDD
jgi:hypothetical protein